MDMESLVHSLRWIDSYDGNIHADHDTYIDDAKSDDGVACVVSNIEYLARQVLVRDSEACNWANISILRRYGFDVKPVKVDTDGWVTGGIHTKRGIITYSISEF